MMANAASAAAMRFVQFMKIYLRLIAIFRKRNETTLELLSISS